MHQVTFGTARKGLLEIWVPATVIIATNAGSAVIGDAVGMRAIVVATFIKLN